MKSDFQTIGWGTVGRGQSRSMGLSPACSRGGRRNDSFDLQVASGGQFLVALGIESLKGL